MLVGGLLISIKKIRLRAMAKLSKGQYFSFDAIAGLLIFVISVGILVTYWYNIQQVIETQDTSTRVIALRISDMLFTEGYPSDWDDPSYDIDEIYMIGLITNGSLDPSKVARLDSLLSSDENRTKLKMKTGGYNFQVVLSEGPLGTVGNPPSCNTTVTTFTRMAPMLGVEPPVAVDVTVRVWACPA